MEPHANTENGTRNRSRKFGQKGARFFIDVGGGGGDGDGSGHGLEEWREPSPENIIPYGFLAFYGSFDEEVSILPRVS